jgi:hypothetical protein
MTLAERAAGVYRARPSTDEAALGRHCFALAPPHSPRRTPALLVEWRRAPDGWEARVVYTARIEDQITVLDTWLPAARLEPA